jgi:hypothetical protein
VEATELIAHGAAELIAEEATELIAAVVTQEAAEVIGVAAQRSGQKTTEVNASVAAMRSGSEARRRPN